MENFPHDDYVHVRDVATFVREAGEVLDDSMASFEDRADANDVLSELANVLGDFGIPVNPKDSEEIADAWDNLAMTGDSTLIRESYFVQAMQEYVTDTGGLPKDLPEVLVIDWKATADNLKTNFTEVDIDGVGYLTRMG